MITDLTMPDMSGLELARQLLSLRPDLPIILCSGFSNHLTEEEAHQIGIREFCLKPLDLKQLARITRKVLDEQS